jgi:hypothetical protein
MTTWSIETKDANAAEDRLRLAHRPMDPDTRLLFEEYLWIGDIPLVLERWSWDGVRASSAVMLAEHVRKLSAAELVAFLYDCGIETGTRVTIKRDGDYVFVNFGFVAG